MAEHHESENHPGSIGDAAATSARVFISYASRDADAAQNVCSALEAAGLPCWMAPRDVKAGARYADAIVGAINEAKAIVLVLSGSAVGSSHVGREVERAASKHKEIVAFRIDGAQLNPGLEYFLSQSQWIDVPKLGTPAALAKLMEAVGQGHTISPQEAPPGRRSGAVGKRVGIAAAILVSVGVLAVAGFHYWSPNHSAAQSAAVAIADKSIAVLPFVDLSEKRDQEYFADGMAEEIINLLANLPELKVISRTSSFQFKGKTEDLRSIGRQLGVAYVLEGGVRRSGDRLRVTAQLINAQDGTHLWSQTYDRDLTDVLKVQDEIAIKVARALEIEVGVRDYLSRSALHNAEAYTLYLKGTHAFNRFDRQGWEQGLGDAQRALDLDPTFADAAAGIAGAYQIGGQVGYVTPAVAFEKSRNAAELALKLNPNLAGVHALLGGIYETYAWDWAAADKEIKLAQGLAPHDDEVVWAAMRQSLILGRWDDALRFVNELHELDPLNPDGYFWLSLIQLPRGQLPEAESAARRALELTPTYFFGSYTLGLVLLARSQPQAALEAMLKEPIDAARLNGSALAYFALGRKADSDAALAQSIRNYSAYPAAIARVHAFRGESDEAFKWLDRAYEQKDSLLYGIKFAPEFDKLHTDPRYKAS